MLKKGLIFGIFILKTISVPDVFAANFSEFENNGKSDNENGIPKYYFDARKLITQKRKQAPVTLDNVQDPEGVQKQITSYQRAFFEIKPLPKSVYETIGKLKNPPTTKKVKTNARPLFIKDGINQEPRGVFSGDKENQEPDNLWKLVEYNRKETKKAQTDKLAQIFKAKKFGDENPEDEFENKNPEDEFGKEKRGTPNQTVSNVVLKF